MKFIPSLAIYGGLGDGTNLILHRVTASPQKPISPSQGLHHEPNLRIPFPCSGSPQSSQPCQRWPSGVAAGLAVGPRRSRRPPLGRRRAARQNATRTNWGGEGNRNLLVAKQQIGPGGEAVADIALAGATGKFEQCGLLIYVHDELFVKQVVEHIDGHHYVVMAWEKTGRGQVIAKTKINQSRAQLRLRVSGDRVEGFWRPAEMNRGKRRQPVNSARNSHESLPCFHKMAIRVNGDGRWFASCRGIRRPAVPAKCHHPPPTERDPRRPIRSPETDGSPSSIRSHPTF